MGVLPGLRRVLEVAVGTGLNLVHYPAGVALTGIDLSPSMLAPARRRTAELGRAVDLRVGDAEALDFDDGSSTRSWAPSRCAPSPTTAARSRRR